MLDSMENPSRVVSNLMQNDYGSTAVARSLANANNNNCDERTSAGASKKKTSHNIDNNSRDNVNKTLTTPRFSAAHLHARGYQSLTDSTYMRSRSRSPTSRRTSGQGSFVLLSSRPRSRMTVDMMPNGEIRQIGQRIEFLLSVINQMCIGFVTIYMSWLCIRNGLQTTGLHAWLVTIGFSLLMAEGVMIHYGGNMLTFNYKRTTKTTIHWVLEAMGGGLGVAGILYKCIQKGFLIQTTHGKLGFSALIFCLATMLSGLGALFSIRIKKLLNPLLNKTVHNVLGITTFVLALTAQYYGYRTGYFTRRVETDFKFLMQTVTLLSLVLSCIGPLKSLYHKTCNIIKHFS